LSVATSKKETKLRSFLGVDWVLFIIYFLFFICGVVIAAPTAIWASEPCRSIFVSIGTAFSTSAIFAYFVELAMSKREKATIQDHRKNYLDGLGYFFYKMCYETLYWYYRTFPDQANNANGLSVGEATSKLSEYLCKHFFPQSPSPVDLQKGFDAMRKIIDSITWVPKSVNASFERLQTNQVLLIEQNILSEEEFNRLSYLCGKIDQMPSLLIPCEYGERLGLILPEAEKFPEFATYLHRKIHIEKGCISDQ
jgi:hypothetical protein